MTTEDLATVIEEMRHIVDQLEQGVAVPVSWDVDTGDPIAWEQSPSAYGVLNLAEAATGDGFASHSGEGGPGADGADPVGELATALAEGGGLADSIRYHRDSVQRGVTGALGDLRLARDALGKLVGKAEVGPGEPGCRVHLRLLGTFESVYRVGRCRWCYDFNLVERIDPPKELLEALREGRRVSASMVAAAVAEERRARRESNKKRRARVRRR